MIIFLLVTLSGMAALSWEVVWQVKSSLALGVSAWGTALTLAVTMGGMAIGSLVMGHFLRNRTVHRPLRIYGLLECIIGLGGLFAGAAFAAVEALDSRVYAVVPQYATTVHVVGIAGSLGVPTIAMGATLPVLGLIARQFNTSIAVLYGLNTFGAALGVLLAAFLWIPILGIGKSTWLFAAINIAVGIAAFSFKSVAAVPDYQQRDFIRTPSQSVQAQGFYLALSIVIVTGFATFMLEVAWFRSMRAAFLSTTDAFAIMLASVLVALAIGAYFAPVLRRSKVSLGVVVALAGIAILMVTPIVERFDLFMHYSTEYPILLFTRWFFLTLYIIGTPVVLLGAALPWLLEEQTTPRRWGILYGANTLAAIFGALCAGWVLLPVIGFARTAWIAGVLVACAGLAIAPRPRRIALGLTVVAAIAAAVVFESGIGRNRAQGALAFSENYEPARLIEAYEGPDATVSVVEYKKGQMILFIDGFSTTVQSGSGVDMFPEHYMPWMGHLPMLVHANPKNALVICFGTGQTANAVRKENPEILDIVDINANVFKLAHHFSANEDVLSDPRVNQIVMDGRAYVRRTLKMYDIITLEPMPPHFAGVNALYSREFYQQARERLTPQGVIAQWLPFHLVPSYYSASIAKTFQSIFPNAILWIDPLSSTGILLGSKDDTGVLGGTLPGYERRGITRDLSERDVKKAILLDREELLKYGAHGTAITDDNQMLAYGKAAYLFREIKRHRSRENFELLAQVKGTAVSEIFPLDPLGR